MPKVLITGASGFIGSTLIAQLNALERPSPGDACEAFALMRKTSSTSNLAGLKYTRVDGDISDFESLKRAVQGMDYVVHLAGMVAAPNRATYMDCNAAGTARVARAIAEANPEANPTVKRVVYVSSLAAGGPMTELRSRTELDADHPVSAYGESKKEGELELLKFKDLYPVSIIRPPLVYGPRDKGVFLVIQTVARGLRPLIQGATPDGHKHYSAIHSEDLCRGIIAAMLQEGQRSGEVYYLADESIYTYEQLLQAMGDALSRKSLKLKVPRLVVKAAGHGMGILGRALGKTFALNPDKLNEILPDFWICSPQKARRDLGYRSQYDLFSGMKQTITWYRKNQWL